MVDSGGAEVAGGTETLGCGAVGRGEAGRGDVGGAVATISGVVVRTDEVLVVRRSETGSEIRGGDGAIGSSVCIPSPPTTPWSGMLLEVSEAVVEAEAFLAASLRAFLAARSASLEERCGAGCRLRAPPAGMTGAPTGPVLAGIFASISSRSIGFLRRKKKEENQCKKR